MNSKYMISTILLFTIFAIIGGYFLTPSSITVTDFVCRTCSVSSSFTSAETFNDKVAFEYQVMQSVQSNDAVLYLKDINGKIKEIYKKDNVFSCTGTSPTIHRYPMELLFIEIDNNFAYVKNQEGFTYNQIIITDMVKPFNLYVVVTESRGTVCNNRGASYKQGVVNLNNVVVLDKQDVITEKPVTTPTGFSAILDDIWSWIKGLLGW